MQYPGSDVDIRVKEITICYDDFGKGDIPIIFIHGFPFDKSMWKPQLDFLKTNHRVIAYDLRGYGKSTMNDQPLSMTLFADDLVKFMDGLQIDKAIVCGLSMGGYILLNAVNRFPERFSAIILADTQCIADTPETREKRKKSIQHILEFGLNEFAKAFVKNVFYKDTLENKKELANSIEKTILSTSPNTIMQTLNALAQRSETCSTLENIAVPVLILCGKEDIITPVAQSDSMQKQIPGSIKKILDEAGHMSNLEQPDKFNEELTGFLKRVILSQAV